MSGSFPAPSPGSAPDLPAPLPGRWSALAAGMLAQAAVSTLQQGLPALGPYLRTVFDLSLPAFGAIIACASWGALATLYLWGRLADLLGERLTVSLGILGAAIALGAVAATQSAIALGVLLCLAGAASASAVSGTGRAVMGWFPRSERGLALGLRQMAVPMGAALSAAVMPVVALAHGLDVAFLCLAGFFTVAAAVALAGLRPPPAAPPGNSPPASQVSPLREPAIWRVSTASGILQWTQVAMTGFFVVILVEHEGVSNARAAMIFAGLLAISGGVRIGIGWASDRLGTRVPLLLGIAVALCALLLVTGLALSSNSMAGLWLLTLACILSLGWNGLAFAAVAEIAGMNRAGRALGLHGTLLRTLTVPTALIFGWLAALAGWPAAVALLAVCPFLAAAMLYRAMLDERTRPRF